MKKIITVFLFAAGIAHGVDDLKENNSPLGNVFYEAVSKKLERELDVSPSINKKSPEILNSWIGCLTNSIAMRPYVGLEVYALSYDSPTRNLIQQYMGYLSNKVARREVKKAFSNLEETSPFKKDNMNSYSTYRSKLVNAINNQGEEEFADDLFVRMQILCEDKVAFYKGLNSNFGALIQIEKENINKRFNIVDLFPTLGLKELKTKFTAMYKSKLNSLSSRDLAMTPTVDNTIEDLNHTEKEFQINTLKAIQTHIKHQFDKWNGRLSHLSN